MARVLDVPYNELTRFTTKKVMNIAALVISVPEEEKKGNSIHSSSSTSPSLRSQSRNQPDGMEKKLPFIQVPTLNKGTVTSVTSKSTTFSPIISDTPTGTYQDALLGTYAVPTQGPRLKVATEGLERTPFHDASFAKWDIRSVPNATSFDEALIMIAQWNKQIDIGLRFRINFEDGTEVAFRRRRPRDSSTLTYTGTYDPSEVFQQRTLPKKSTLREALGKSLIFTADEKGHPVPKSVQKTQYKMYLSSSMPQFAASTMYDGQRSTCEPTRGLLSKRAPVSSALHFPTPSQRTALFQSLDVNGNGVLSLAELDKAVVEIWPQLNSKPAIMRAYKAADKNGTGWLGKKEFRYFLRYLSQYVNMWRLFLSVDTSGDRRISFAEFQTAQQKALRSQLSEHELRVAFSTMDRNGGGYVLFDEFCAWMAAVKTDALESKETQLI